MNTGFKKNNFLSRKLKNYKLKSFFFFSRNLKPRLIGGQATTPPHRRAGYHPASSAGRLQPSKGFTLVEMLVSISVFLVVMTVATGSLLSIIDGNGKAQSLKSAMNNLNFALESMGKSIRIGNTYECNNIDCSIGDTAIQFASPNDLNGDTFINNLDTIVYRYNTNNGSIERCITSELISCNFTSNSFIRLTAPEVAITDMKFYIPASSPPQRVLITVNGKAGSKSKTETVFNLQTTVTQR